MSTLKQLIKKFCPHGVEYVRLGDLCKIKTGIGITKKEMCEDGRYKIISGGKTPMGKCDYFNRFANTVTIARAGSAGYVNFIYDDFYLNDKCFSVIPKSKIIMSRFLYFYLKANQYYIYSLKSSGTVPTININKISKIKVPLPPLPVQEEIVKILDKFTDLENELENELRMRKMQFNAYRDKLLTFDNGVKFEKLGDLCEIETGKLNANQSVSNGTYKFFTTSKKISKINTYRWNCEAILLPGNANLENIHYYRGKFNAYQRVYVIHEFSDKINPKFLYHMLLSNFKKYLKGNTNEATILYVVIDTVKKYYFPVPPLEKQKEIVEKLDKFNEMCNEISERLPLEIELRKKQKKYILNKLLNI